MASLCFDSWGIAARFAPFGSTARRYRNNACKIATKQIQPNNSNHPLALNITSLQLFQPLDCTKQTRSPDYEYVSTFPPVLQTSLRISHLASPALAAHSPINAWKLVPLLETHASTFSLSERPSKFPLSSSPLHQQANQLPYRKNPPFFGGLAPRAKFSIQLTFGPTLGDHLLL